MMVPTIPAKHPEMISLWVEFIGVASRERTEKKKKKLVIFLDFLASFKGSKKFINFTIFNYMCGLLFGFGKKMKRRTLSAAFFKSVVPYSSLKDYSAFPFVWQSLVGQTGVWYTEKISLKRRRISKLTTTSFVILKTIFPSLCLYLIKYRD